MSIMLQFKKKTDRRSVGRGKRNVGEGAQITDYDIISLVVQCSL